MRREHLVFCTAVAVTVVQVYILIRILTNKEQQHEAHLLQQA